MKVSVAQLCLTLRPHGLWPASLLCPWNSSGKNTGVGCHSLLQGIFPTQGLNPGFPHCRQILYHLSSSLQFSHSVVSDSLQPHEPQHARPPCPSPPVALNAQRAWNLFLLCVFSSPTILLFKDFFCFLGHFLFFLPLLPCLLTLLILVLILLINIIYHISEIEKNCREIVENLKVIIEKLKNHLIPPQWKKGLLIYC